MNTLELKDITHVKHSSDNSRESLRGFNFSFQQGQVYSTITVNESEATDLSAILASIVEPLFGSIETTSNWVGVSEGYRGAYAYVINEQSLNHDYRKVNNFLIDSFKRKPERKAAFEDFVQEQLNEIRILNEKLINYKSNKSYLKFLLDNDIDEEIMKDHQSKLNIDIKNQKKYASNLNKIAELTFESEEAKRKFDNREMVISRTTNSKSNSRRIMVEDFIDWIKKEMKNESKELKRVHKDTEKQLNIIQQKFNSEVSALIQLIVGLEIPGMEFDTKTNNLIKSISLSKSNPARTEEQVKKFISYAQKLAKMVNVDDRTKINEKINYLENIRDLNSPINTKAFNRIHNFWEERINNKITEYDYCISDIEIKVKLLVKASKAEKKEDMRKKLEDDISSLIYQKQIYIEKKHVVLEYLEDITSAAHKHNERYLKGYYNAIIDFEKQLLIIDTAFNEWKGKKVIASEKVLLDITLKRNKTMIDKLVKENKKIEKKLLSEKAVKNGRKQIAIKLSKYKNKSYNTGVLTEKQLEIFENQKTKINGQLEILKQKVLLAKKRMKYSGKDEEIEMKILDLFELLSLPNTISESNWNDLSKLEKEKLSLVKAVIEDKSVIILHDPSTDINVSSKTSLGYAIKTIASAYHKLIVIVTDNISQAAKISDKMIILEQGKVVEYGKSKLVESNPKNKLTKQMISTINKTKYVSKDKDIGVEYSNEVEELNEYVTLKEKQIERDHYVFQRIIK